MSPDPPSEPSPSADRGRPVDLRDDGLLWLINRCVFHPRGYALAIDPAEPGKFWLLGDGSEVWSMKLPDEIEDELFAKTRAVMP